MTTSLCDLVAERLALGEPLAEQPNLANHAASCAACQALTRTTSLLAGTHREIEPGLGFAARVTVGAQGRLVARRRRRIVAAAVTSAVAAVLVTYVAVRPASTSSVAIDLPRPTEPSTRDAGIAVPDHPDRHDHGEVDPDVATLVYLANTDRSRRLAARWSRIERSLAPYRALVAHTGATP
jgi:hypothetical protein